MLHKRHEQAARFDARTDLDFAAAEQLQAAAHGSIYRSIESAYHLRTAQREPPFDNAMHSIIVTTASKGNNAGILRAIEESLGLWDVSYEPAHKLIAQDLSLEFFLHQIQHFIFSKFGSLQLFLQHISDSTVNKHTTRLLDPHWAS
jgi:hypothetical protein